MDHNTLLFVKMSVALFFAMFTYSIIPEIIQFETDTRQAWFGTQVKLEALFVACVAALIGSRI